MGASMEEEGSSSEAEIFAPAPLPRAVPARSSGDIFLARGVVAFREKLFLWDPSENDRATTEVDLWLHEQAPDRQDYRFTEP